MDDNAAKENPPTDFNKLDLSQLQSFSFGTQWTQDKSAPSDRREPRSDRPRRDDNRPGNDARPDRRGFRKPAGAPFGGDAPSQAPANPAAPSAPQSREFSGDRRPQRDFRSGPGGPRRDGPGGGERGPRYAPRGEMPPQDRGPYDSPYFSATFYPEDTSFNALAKTIRASCRTIELFEIARTVVGKNDRFVVVLARKPAGAKPGEGEAAAKPQPIYISVPDGLPFESEDAALSHVFQNHLTTFFDSAEVEVDAPKGNFQVINKCGVTGELLGPPNYHRYNQLVQQHYAAKISNMPFETFRARIETVRDPEVTNQWLAKMKKVTRYTWKLGAKPAPVAAPAPAAPVAENADAAAPVAEAPAAAPAPEAAPALTFDSLEDARTYLLTQARDKVVRSIDSARFHGKIVETLPQGEIRRAIEGALERQRRFPLDTANALRGRLRREHFTIFKKGSKGVSYVCAVKRKFRVPGQTFSDSIGALINFIEAHPMVKASELASKFLNITAPAAAVEGKPAEPAAELTVEQREKLARLQGDLRWLVTEGYVTEFIDGRLFAPPAVVESRKKEAENAEHDPENFPDVPTTEAKPVAAASAPVGEASVAAPEAAPVAEVKVAAPATEAEAAPEASKPVE